MLPVLPRTFQPLVTSKHDLNSFVFFFNMAEKETTAMTQQVNPTTSSAGVLYGHCFMS